MKNWNRYQSTEKFNKIIKSTKVIEENENEKRSENETIDKIRKDKTIIEEKRKEKGIDESNFETLV